MSVLPMQKIRLCIHRDYADEVLEHVQKHGIVELHAPNDETLIQETQQVFDANYEASRLDFTIHFLEQYEDVGIISKVLEGVAVHTNSASIEKTVHSFNYSDIVSDIQNLEEKMNTIKAKRQELQEHKRILMQWDNVEIPLNQSLNTRYTTTHFFTASRDAYEAITEHLTQLSYPYHLEQIGATEYTITIFHEDREKTERILSDAHAEIVNLPSYSGTPRTAIQHITSLLSTYETERKNVIQQTYEYTIHLPQLRMIADYMHWKKDRETTLFEHGRKTDTVIFFDGWCPAHELDRLYYTIDSITHAFEIEYLDTDINEEKPVAISNKGILHPFESVTRLYGVPSSKDIDPTVYLSGFFFISFGLCLTDVGYGIFLTSITGMLLILFRTKREMRQLLILLLFGGISSLLVGLVFGGYFGMDINILPQWARDIQYFDPINAPLPFFYLTLILGFIQISIGMILDIIRQARYNTLTDGILDNGPWLVLFAGITMYIGATIDIFSSQSSATGIMIAGALLLIITQGRKKDGFIQKALGGILSLYGVVNHFSDVLSFSRLLALGLATSALAFSINMIAVMLRDMIPIIGPVAMVVMLVVGHTFNLVVNVLGAYIHTARLQFVEFFGKFLTGTGSPFKPFNRTEQNVVLIDK